MQLEGVEMTILRGQSPASRFLLSSQEEGTLTFTSDQLMKLQDVGHIYLLT